MKYYKVVRSYKNRLFSYTASNREVQSIINKQKRTKELAAVEYRVDRWTFVPKIGFYHPGINRMLYVYCDLDAAIGAAECDPHYHVYECEVINPKTPFSNRFKCLVDGVRLIKRVA